MHLDGSWDIFIRRSSNQSFYMGPKPGLSPGSICKDFGRSIAAARDTSQGDLSGQQLMGQMNGFTQIANQSVLDEAGLFDIEVYIQRRRDTVFNFVKNREIYQECLELETDVENSEFTYWWKQPFNLVANVITT